MKDLPINPSINDVVKAYKFLKNRVRHTPTEYSHALSEIAGAPVFVKWESQQLCGSFKVRGATYKMNSLSREEIDLGVVTCSSGNHGQGVAMAAKELKIKTKIFVPGDCPETKKAAIKWRGGEYIELVIVPGNYDDAETASREYAKKVGATYISSFEDATVMAGQGTVGLEMFMDEPEIELLLVPAGGGGLLNGVSIAAKALAPNVEIWGVQSEASNPWVISWEGGIVKEADYSESIADGLFGAFPQSLLNLAKTRVSGILEVTEEEIMKAISFMHREQHQVIEGAGAVGIAALMAGKAPVKGRRTGIVVSGGNIDDNKLRKILQKY